MHPGPRGLRVLLHSWYLIPLFSSSRKLAFQNRNVCPTEKAAVQRHNSSVCDIPVLEFLSGNLMLGCTWMAPVEFLSNGFSNQTDVRLLRSDFPSWAWDQRTGRCARNGALEQGT